MHETETGFREDGNVEPLLPPNEDPLMLKRIALSQILGEILADPNRYNSFEWFDVIEAIREVTYLIRSSKVDTSRYHSSTSFPMRINPGAEMIRKINQIAPEPVQASEDLAA
jgi:hypothetical protein